LAAQHQRTLCDRELPRWQCDAAEPGGGHGELHLCPLAQLVHQHSHYESVCQRKDGGAMRVHGPRRRRQKEQGQALIPIIIMIGLFLLAMLGVAMDYSQIWAHRQMAQAAADASCQAGAADLYLNAVDPSVGGQNGLQSFTWIGSAFD